MSRATENAWISFRRSDPAASVRLFCFHHAGGAASAYRRWREKLPPRIEVCPVQLPGRENRFSEKPYTSLRALVGPLAEGLERSLDKPYALFGHSMGALVGFELARKLRERRSPLPRHIFVSGFRAPHRPDRGKRISELSQGELVAELRGMDATPREILESAEALELMLPILRADFTIGDTYVHAPEPPLDVPITAWGGLQDPYFTREDIEAWREQTTARFTATMLDGRHFFVRDHEERILAEIARALA